MAHKHGYQEIQEIVLQHLEQPGRFLEEASQREDAKPGMILEITQHRLENGLKKLKGLSLNSRQKKDLMSLKMVFTEMIKATEALKRNNFAKSQKHVQKATQHSAKYEEKVKKEVERYVRA